MSFDIWLKSIFCPLIFNVPYILIDLSVTDIFIPTLLATKISISPFSLSLIVDFVLRLVMPCSDYLYLSNVFNISCKIKDVSVSV